MHFFPNLFRNVVKSESLDLYKRFPWFFFINKILLDCICVFQVYDWFDIQITFQSGRILIYTRFFCFFINKKSSNILMKFLHPRIFLLQNVPTNFPPVSSHNWSSPNLYLTIYIQPYQTFIFSTLGRFYQDLIIILISPRRWYIRDLALLHHLAL